MSPEVTRIEAAVRRRFEDEPRVAAVHLFGSAARDALRPDSDVDVAVLYSGERPRSLEALPLDAQEELAAELGRPVEIVVLNGAPVDLVHRVLLEGRLLLERDASARVGFEVRARSAYFDLLPHLLRYRRMEDVWPASHIVSDRRLGEPRTNRELFERLVSAGLLGADLGRSLGRMAGFRNVLVHGYAEVDVDVLRDVLENRLDDLAAFVDAVRAAEPALR